MSSVFRKIKGLSHSHEIVLLVLLLAVPNIVVWLIFYPGYIQADHQAAIARLASGSPSQWHSLLWTAFALPFIYYSPSYGIYGLVQIALFIAIVVFSLLRLKNVGVVKSTLPVGCFFAFFPTFLMYNELYASDTVYAYTLIAISALLIELVCTKGDALKSNGYMAWLTVFSVLATCLRKNAIILFFVIFILIIALYRPYIKRLLVFCSAGLASIMLVVFVIPAAIEATPSPSQEMLSVPCLQIAHVFAADGDIPEQEYNDLTSMRSAEDWSKSYLSYCADFAKAGIELDLGFLRDWVVLGLHNPRLYIETYLLLECPFWQFGMTGYGSYNDAVCGSDIDFGNNESFTLDNSSGLSQSYVQQFGNDWGWLHSLPSRIYTRVNELHIPLITTLFNFVLFNRALPVWTLLLLLFYSLRKNVFKDALLVSLPVLITVLSLLAFAPVALFRYAMESYYALPLIYLWVHSIRSKTRCKIVCKDAAETKASHLLGCEDPVCDSTRFDDTEFLCTTSKV